MKKIISYSLWGDNPIYTVGAISNAIAAQSIYPGWICRFYIHEQSIPSNILEKLQTQPNVELVNMPEDIGWSGMLWRFYPATENDVSVMLSRDCDSRLTLREKACVYDWLNYTNKDVMTIRDTCVHQSQMMGGLWGVRNGYLKHIKNDLDTLINKTKNKAIKGIDQEFLNSKIYLRSLGIVNTSYQPLNETEFTNSQFVSYDDIAFGKKRFGNYLHIPHYRELIKPTPIQRKYKDSYIPCVHCGLKHDDCYIGKVESLSGDELNYLNLSEEQKLQREQILKSVDLYRLKEREYGFAPYQHMHGSPEL